MFVKRDDLPKPLPRAFRYKVLKNVRAVADCTEIKVNIPQFGISAQCKHFKHGFLFQIETPGNLDKQGNCYSNYKHHCTLKVLIFVTPAGGASFISPPFEGSCSDRQAFNDCGVADYFDRGDVFVGDRGFNVNDLVANKGATMKTPPSGPGDLALSKEDEIYTKVIARARVHIERWNQRMKTFKFVSGIIDETKNCVMKQAIYVAGCLANFSECLVK